MSIVTFWNNNKEQCGSTSSCIAVATQMAIEHNMKILLMSTSLNDSLMKDCFWHEKKSRLSGLFGPNTSFVDQNGIEGLDRVIRSNKVSPNIIKDYTKVVLTDRLEILLSLNGEKSQYEAIQQKFSQIMLLANQYYDMVIVDLDKNLNFNIKEEILKNSDLIITLLSQRQKEIEKIMNEREQEKIIRKRNSLYAIGKYVKESKYNVKNISRNILKQRQTINVIPYNHLFFEASQEGNVLDLFLNFLRLNDQADENYQFFNEIKSLSKQINERIKELSQILE